jgi:hypothetical protein
VIASARAYRLSGGCLARNDGHIGNRGLDSSWLVEADQLILPDGQISSCFPKWSVQPLLQKYFASRLTQISSLSRTVSSHRGAIARRHERGAGCGGRESVRRAMAIAGRDEPRERSAACKMIGAFCVR